MIATLDSPGQALSGYTQPADPYLKTTVAYVGFVHQSRDAWRKVVRALEPLRGLRNDWDGLGAAAPSIELVDSAIELANYLSRIDHRAPTTVAPTPAGTILFTWEDAEYWELEIRLPYHAEWMRVDGRGTVTHGDDLIQLINSM